VKHRDLREVSLVEFNGGQPLAVGPLAGMERAGLGGGAEANHDVGVGHRLAGGWVIGEQAHLVALRKGAVIDKRGLAGGELAEGGLNPGAPHGVEGRDRGAFGGEEPGVVHREGEACGVEDVASAEGDLGLQPAPLAAATRELLTEARAALPAGSDYMQIVRHFEARADASISGTAEG